MSSKIKFQKAAPVAKPLEANAESKATEAVSTELVEKKEESVDPTLASENADLPPNEDSVDAGDDVKLIEDDEIGDAKLLEASDSVDITPELIEEPAVTTSAPELDVIAPESPTVETPVNADELPLEVKLIKDSLAAYLRVMGNTNRPSERDMADAQTNLHNVYLMLFRLRGALFLKALETILVFFNQNSNFCFKEKYMFRGVTQMRIGATEQSMFKSITVLFTKLADPADRPIVKNHIDINLALRNVNNGEEIAALINEFIN